MVKKFAFCILLACSISSGFSQTRVVLLPVLHGLHKTNTAYNYDSLKNTVTRFYPDLIAVEIRSDDITGDSSYLGKNYPREMWMMRYWFPGVEIDGYDWLGKDLEGRRIPDQYWKNEAPVKLLEKQLSNDSVYSEKLTTCSPLVEERIQILSKGSLHDILEKDGALVKKYYECIEEQLKGSAYEGLNLFYSKRNNSMMDNIRRLVNKNSGATIVILTGADHYPYLFDFLQSLNVVLLHP